MIGVFERFKTVDYMRNGQCIIHDTFLSKCTEVYSQLCIKIYTFSFLNIKAT